MMARRSASLDTEPAGDLLGRAPAALAQAGLGIEDADADAGAGSAGHDLRLMSSSAQRDQEADQGGDFGHLLRRRPRCPRSDRRDGGQQSGSCPSPTGPQARSSGSYPGAAGLTGGRGRAPGRPRAPPRTRRPRGSAGRPSGKRRRGARAAGRRAASGRRSATGRRRSSPPPGWRRGTPAPQGSPGRRSAGRNAGSSAEAPNEPIRLSRMIARRCSRRRAAETVGRIREAVLVKGARDEVACRPRTWRREGVKAEYRARHQHEAGQAADDEPGHRHHGARRDGRPRRVDSPGSHGRRGTGRREKKRTAGPDGRSHSCHAAGRGARPISSDCLACFTPRRTTAIGHASSDFRNALAGPEPP